MSGGVIPLQAMHQAADICASWPSRSTIGQMENGPGLSVTIRRRCFYAPIPEWLSCRGMAEQESSALSGPPG